jgi:hypothetical protein
MQRDMNRDEIAEICEATPLFIADMILEQKKTIAQLEAELAAAKNETESANYWRVRNRDERDQLQRKLDCAVGAIRQSIARSDDYGDSYCSKPIREALEEINNG